MKTDKRTLFLGVALVVVAGLFTANVSGLMSVKATPMAKTMGANGAYMVGHVTTILTDSQGNVKQYRQSDNVVTNNGENCVLRMLFQAGASRGAGSGTGACTGTLTNPWDVIAVGTGTGKANGTDYVLGTELTANGFQRGVATTKTWTNSSGNGATSSAQIVLAKTFTNTGTSTQVAESGLFNTTSASTNSMFARQNFTAITVANGDSLTVQWTINVGGTQFNLAQ